MNWKNISSIVAIVASVIAVYISYNASQIAQKSYDLSYSNSRPIITAVPKILNADNMATEIVEITNSGGPLRDFEVYGDTYTQIYLNGKTTCIPILLYIYNNPSDKNYTGTVQDLVVTLNNKGNYSKFLAMKKSFEDAAYNSTGYYPSIVDPTTYLHISYRDPSGKTSTTEYIYVNNPSFNINEQIANEKSTVANENEKSASYFGVSFYIDSLDGSKMWDWYKATFLQ
jgi:hypothetical protein